MAAAENWTRAFTNGFEGREIVDIKRYKMLIGGDWVDASDGKEIDSINPATGQIWASFPEATAEDVDRAVRAAHKAFSDSEWASFTPTERGRRLYQLADLLEQHSETFGQIETTDTGKLYQETRFQAAYIAEFYRFFAGCADKLHGDTLPIDKKDMFVYTLREPLGVVAAIVPWNSQLFLSAIKIGPALAAGNSIVVKASEHAPAALLEFARLFKVAGIPDGVVNIVTGHGEPCGSAMTSHPLIAKIAFTGGPAAARHVVRNSANNLASLTLELGGKSPVIVFDDANIETAVNGALSAIFGATGQSCVAGSRLYLHDAIADHVLEQMAAQAKKIRLGDPLDPDTEIGPICTLGQTAMIEKEIAHALKEGATLVCGGKRHQHLGGNYFEPTIIECPQQDLRIVDTELFGPVLSVLRFHDEEEVLRLANDSKHGLAAGVFTTDSARALRMTRALQAGIIWVNTYRVVSPVAEAGGMKTSGYGRESGFQAIYDYTQSKTVWINTSDDPLGSHFIAR